MSGALLGFKINGEKKLLKLHGDRNCETVLTDLLAYLRHVSNARLTTYAQALKTIGPELGPFPDDASRRVMEAFFEGHFEESCKPITWAEAFSEFPELEGWHAGFPFMPSAVLSTCGDVAWGFLLDLDRQELQIYDNRNARFHWRDMGGTQRAYCTLPMAYVRELTEQDISAIQGLLLQHAYANGIDPTLPLQDAMSAPFPGPGAWQAKLLLSHGRVRLLLQRGKLHAKIRQVGELRLNDPHCGELLSASLEPNLRAMAQGIYGAGASVWQIALVAEHLPKLPFNPQVHGLPLLDLGLRPASGLTLPLDANFFDAVRAEFLGAGMSLQGWRFLIKQNHDVLRFLLQYFPPSTRILKDFVRFVNLLAIALQNEPLQIGRCQPALRGVDRILDRTRGRPSAIREANAQIFLRALMRAVLSAEEEANLAHEAQDVSDFVYTHAGELKGATWHSLCRRSDDWHRSLLISVDPERDVHWPALLPSFDAGHFQAIELDSGFLLAEEGLEQRHCIGTYANACASGGTRVFSLRHGGKRAATLELQRDHGGHWQMVQIRGKANTIIHDPELLQAAERVVQAYDQAARMRVTPPPKEDPSHEAREYVPLAYLIPPHEHRTG